MRRIGAAAVAVVVTFALGAALVSARATHFASHVQILGFDGATVNNLTIFGRVTSPKAKCVPNRKVKLIYLSDLNGNHVVDVARTSNNGYWAGHGDFGGAENGAKARLVPKKFGRPHHRKVCDGDVDTDNLAG